LDEHTIGYIKYVLSCYPEILCDGSRVFLPAHVRRIGHNSVRDHVFELREDAVVIVLNGVEKIMQYKSKESDDMITIDLVSDTEELSETIARNIVE